MEVYRIEFDINHYQSLVTVDESREMDGSLTFVCESRSHSWDPPEVFILKPKLIPGDFFYMPSGNLVATSRAVDTLGSILTDAAELLPLPYKSETHSIINILACVDCLDIEGSDWTNGFRPTFTPSKYAFLHDRLNASLFKIPQSKSVTKFALERTKDPRAEFKACVEASGLMGLLFDCIWSDDPDFPVITDAANPFRVRDRK